MVNQAEVSGNVSHTCRYFGVPRDTFYRWKLDYTAVGESGLINSKPCPENLKIRIASPIDDKILYLRCHYHFALLKISWHLQCYHTMSEPPTGVYGVLCRHGLNKLPQHFRKRRVKKIRRYEKRGPGHHIHADVKFLDLIDKHGRKYRRHQYTAIDDATRIRALKVYCRHNQANAINFINHVVDKFSFGIKFIRTDNGHEFQAKFHWHVEDLGMIHAYMKPACPHLNSRGERSHLTGKQEFYQLMPTQAMSIWSRNPPNGSTVTLSCDPIRHSREKHLMRFSSGRRLCKPDSSAEVRSRTLKYEIFYQ